MTSRVLKLRVFSSFEQTHQSSFMNLKSDIHYVFNKFLTFSKQSCITMMDNLYFYYTGLLTSVDFNACLQCWCTVVTVYDGKSEILYTTEMLCVITVMAVWTTFTTKLKKTIIKVLGYNSYFWHITPGFRVMQRLFS